MTSKIGKRLKIRLDRRELTDRRVAYVIREYADVEVEDLPLGDIATEHCLIERKDADDYVSSLIDGRLFSQMNRMFDSGKPCFLVIHGEVTTARVTREQLEGSLAAISAEYGIPWMWHQSMEVVLRCAVNIMKKVEEGKYLTPRRLYVRKKSKAPFCVQKVAKLCDVPEKVAVELLRKYGSIVNIAKATEAELKCIEGIGTLRALHIVAVCQKDWRKKK